ncbi:Outer membrane lipoprotein blc precursor [Thiorhodovibrio winogradskyi]|uniref:Outer membrane lipoprotein blc n=1 Tax=Thiorhodovibrio winogradskyi TaxID=77007 RepID=A0ABZ0SBX9_9GAMM|nr:lipocalin family protein [Thiorhodovibrio winogradskyi]
MKSSGHSDGGKTQVRRRAGRGALARERDIYAAPPHRRDADGADVIVSTELRKPKVYLTAPSTVDRVDLPRFMGRWYEMARLPYFTERRCVDNVVADYRLGEDGMVHVSNRCRYRDGRISEAKGVARVLDYGRNARLQISFRMLYGVYVFWDDYWIIGLGADYDYALIGQPTKTRAWVLARDPLAKDALVDRWLSEFGDKGFPAASFLRTRQDAAGLEATGDGDARAPGLGEPPSSRS